MILKSNENISFRLRVVKGRLAGVGVVWAVFAGAAAYCYGSKRKVTDVDLLVKGVDLEKAKAVLRGVEGVDVVADLKLNVNGCTYRFFMDGEMEDRIQRRTLFGVEVPVVAVEDNMVFRAVLQRGEAQGKHDVEDIEWMVKSEKIDREYLWRRIRKCHVQDRVKPLLESMGVL